MTAGRGAGDWQDIGRKLPLLTTILLSLAVVGIAATAYVEMKRALLAASGERLMGVSAEVASAFSQASIRMARDGTPLSHDATIRNVLAHPSAATMAAALTRLNSEIARNPLDVLVELRDAHGARIAAAGDTMLPPPADGRGSPVLPLIAVHNTVFTDSRVPVLDAGADTLGFVRDVSRASSPSTQLLNGLIGGNARLLLGNASGNVWTDLNKRVDGPRGVTNGRPTAVTMADGTLWLGTQTAITAAPWVVWVGRPESSILAVAHNFLLTMLLVALVVIVLGGVGARVLCRHIIAPLAELTGAVEGIAAGDYSTRVAADRRDEVGRLAIAFNGMGQAIQSASIKLENQQTELENQQAELEESNEQLQASVTDLTRARDAERRSHARAEAVVAGAIDAVIMIDEDDHIVAFNPAAERTFCCASSDVVGRPITELILPPESADGQEASIAHTLGLSASDGTGPRVELTALRADGSHFPVEFAITRMPIRGVRMFTCFVRDVSAHKQLEAQLQQAQKMEAIGRLAGGVAHDFNNILTVIISYTDLVLADQTLTDMVRSDLTHVRTGADRASALTRQLLVFSRKQVLHPKVLSLNTVVTDVMTMLTRVMPANIVVSTALDEAAFPVFVDRGQLEQVLMNLAVNARDAMPNGGSLVIETANAMLDDAYVALHPGGTPGPHVVLLVRDTGTGMDSKTRERIFEPFFTTKEAGRGTGLGLAMVYGIVRQSGGSIYVYSEPELGTTFKVYFPAHKAGQRVLDDVSATQLPVVEPARVLLVEDDPAVRKATTVVLEQLGHTVVSAENVAAALEIVRAGTDQFDIVLTDAVMPGRSGSDLAEILREEVPALPVIIMSGYAEDSAGSVEPTSNGVVFLEKPFNAPSVTRAFAAARGKQSSTEVGEDWIT